MSIGEGIMYRRNYRRTTTLAPNTVQNMDPRTIHTFQVSCLVYGVLPMMSLGAWRTIARVAGTWEA